MGKRVELSLRTEPNSLCAVSGVDKSVTFMGARNSVNIQNVSFIIKFERILFRSFASSNCQMKILGAVHNLNCLK